MRFKLAFTAITLFALTACISRDEIERSAEVNANAFAEDMQIRYTGISCSGADSDQDGYTSCTINTASEGLKSIECGYTQAFAPLGQNTSCKQQRAINVGGDGLN